ncbi:hypothetical protein [Albidovulum sp.]|uniref:hypothetical protein n=1 Tax=Albidovulum sp. TaxID=1872424 RepID=UPI0039B916E4
MGTLAKVAVVKGVGSMMQKAGAGGTAGTAGSGGTFGGPHSPTGGLGDMLGGALGGRKTTGGTAGGTTTGGTAAGGAGGGIGDLFEELGNYRSGPAGTAQAPT